MKTIFCAFEHVFIKLQVNTSLESNTIYSVKNDDLILFVFDNDVDVSEFHKQDEHLMNSVGRSYTVSDDYSTQRQYHKSEERFQMNFKLVKNQLLSNIRQLETNKSAYTVYQMI